MAPAHDIEKNIYYIPQELGCGIKNQLFDSLNGHYLVFTYDIVFF